MGFDQKYVFDTAKRLLAVDSPSGFTQKATAELAALCHELGYGVTCTSKGNVMVDIPGKDHNVVALCAHLDTLGLMVRAIKSDGKLAITKIGGPLLPTLDGAYCRVYTRQGMVYTGTILSTSPAAHVYEDAATKERMESALEIRLDEVVKTGDEVRALGISAGDYICYDTKTQSTPSGFLKSRFLDDKLGCALLLGLVKAMKDTHTMPTYTLKLIFTVFEEVGHGLASLPQGITELVAVDMGCIGEDLTCTEYDVSICAKDSDGPYDYELTSRLIALAKERGIPYAVDIYPRYGSDVGVARRAGHDVRGALIGPGVHASHGMERAHWKGMEATMTLLAAYVGMED